MSFCAEKGTLVQESPAAALLLYTRMPVQIREQVILESKGIAEPDMQFWQDFADALQLSLPTRQTGIRQEKRRPKKTRDR